MSSFLQGPRNIPEIDEDEVRLDELDVTQVSCLGKDRYSKLLLSGEGKKVNKVDGSPACVYCVIMHCTSRNTTTRGRVKLAKHPLDVLCIQEAIECDYNIPVSTQQLRYKSAPISSREYVRTLGIKSGDTLEVCPLASLSSYQHSNSCFNFSPFFPPFPPSSFCSSLTPFPPFSSHVPPPPMSPADLPM